MLWDVFIYNINSFSVRDVIINSVCLHANDAMCLLVVLTAVPPLTSPGPLPSITMRGEDVVSGGTLTTTVGQYRLSLPPNSQLPANVRACAIWRKKNEVKSVFRRFKTSTDVGLTSVCRCAQNLVIVLTSIQHARLPWRQNDWFCLACWPAMRHCRDKRSLCVSSQFKPRMLSLLYVG